MPSAYHPVATVDRQEHLDRYFAYRCRYLPQQIEAARRKLAALETEAARYGLTELLGVTEHG